MVRGSQWFKFVAAGVIAIAFVIGFEMAVQPAAQAHAPQAPATTIVVNSLDDTSGTCSTTGTDPCTLRDAIAYANNTAGADTINFSVSGIISLTSGLVITDDVTIDGSGQNITLNGNKAVQVLNIYSGTNVSLNALTIANGECHACNGSGIYNNGTLTVTNSTVSGNGAGYDLDGGGIYNNGTLNVANSTFDSNTTLEFGGGIYNNGGAATVISSTFSGNQAQTPIGGGSRGGGIYNISGTLTVANSTFVSNRTNTYGGGIDNINGTLIVTNSTFSSNNASDSGYGGGINNQGTLTVTNSTFSNNNAYNGGGIDNLASDYYMVTLNVANSTFSFNNAYYGGGIYNGGTVVAVTNSTFSRNGAAYGGGIYDGGPLTVTNSTFSANYGNYGGSIANGYTIAILLQNTILANSLGGVNNCYAAFSGSITADHYNLADDASCGNATHKTSAQIKLGPLANNGGATQTFALLPGSAAINAGNGAVCPATDQRGVARPQGAHCDAGAYQFIRYIVFLPLVRR